MSKSMPIQCFPVIGHNNTGKSTLIRALTGVGNIAKIPGFNGKRASQNWRLDWLGVGVVNTFVQGSSLQEARIAPDEFVGAVLDSGATRVIVALHHLPSNGQTFPNGADYLHYFKSRGWMFATVASVGDIAVGDWPITAIKPQGPGVAASSQAAILRTEWMIA